MEKKTYWRGVEGVEMLWHGEWADPELRYDNIVASSVEVEEDLYSQWESEQEETGEYIDFSLWCQEHRGEVIDIIYLCQRYDSKRYNFFDALDCGAIIYEDPILIDGLFIKEVRLDDECRMWIRTIDDVDHELEQKSVFDKHTREFVNYYGDFDTESTLIIAHAEQMYGAWRWAD